MKRRFFFLLISIGVLLWACNPTGPGVKPSASALPTATSTSTTPPPTVTPSGETPCSFVWATRDLPDLSERLAKELQSVDPAATGSAYSYGEDCVAADGTRTFSAMETDFQIRISVRDLSDKESLGNWIAKVMPVILGLPASDLQGPQPGRAEFEFRSANSDSRRLNVNIDAYEARSSGLVGARLFEMLDTLP
jgi:hypothetical protein